MHLIDKVDYSTEMFLRPWLYSSVSPQPLGV